MSAFMCSDRHIAILAQYAAFPVDLTCPDKPRIPPCYLPPADPEWPDPLERPKGSAATVLDSLNYFAAVLHQTNEIAMQHRYGDELKGDPPQFTKPPTPEAIEAFRDSVTYAEIARLAHSYTYQACEHEGWHRTTAYHLIALIHSELAEKLPGYEAAAWSV